MEKLTWMVMGWVLGNLICAGLFGAVIHHFLFGDDPEDKPEARPDAVPRLDIRDIP